MNVERLQKLAAYLRTVNDYQFNYLTWYSSASCACGTVACALGWAAVMPEFVALGLKPVPGLFGEVPYCKGQLGIGAAMKFFELTYTQAEWIFADGNLTLQDPTGPRIAYRIERMVNAELGRMAKTEAARVIEQAATAIQCEEVTA